MTDPEMRGLACQALNIMRHDIERKRFNFLLAQYIEGEGLRRMRKVETLIIEKMGEGWLSNGAAKDAAFTVMRFVCSIVHPAALILGTAANVFQATAELLALPPEEQQRAMEAGHDEHHRMVKRGLLTLEDALVVTVQTETRVAVCRAVNGKPLAINFGAQSEYNGRTKLYGDPAEARAELAKLVTSLDRSLDQFMESLKQ